MNDYAAMHCNTECRYNTVITLVRVDKSAESIGRQVNALHCSSTHYRQRAGIGYLEFALNVQCVLPALSTHFL